MKKIDFAVLTIRPDEFRAVHKRFQNWEEQKGRHNYFVTKIANGRSLALVRTLESGNSRAQQTTTNLIFDLNPSWIFLVGIGGGFPDFEFGLGDVLLSSRLQSFAVWAAIQDSQPEWALRGDRIHADAERFLESIFGHTKTLGKGLTQAEIGVPRPALQIPSDISDETLYGSNEWRKKVVDSLRKHHTVPRDPTFYAAPVLDGNALIKDASLAATFKENARDSAFAEMEIGGAMMAARDRPIMSIRGLSDIVGYKRSPEWTSYACETAAAMLKAIVTSDLISPQVLITKPSEGASLLTELFGVGHEMVGVGHEMVGTLKDTVSAWRYGNRLDIATAAAKKLKDTPSLSRIVAPGFLVPLFEAAGDVEEIELKELWAQLLAGAIKDKNLAKRSFIERLREMSVTEARVLKVISEGRLVYMKLFDRERTNKAVKLIRRKDLETNTDLLSLLGCHEAELFSSLSRLSSIGLINVSKQSKFVPVQKGESRKQEEYRSSITEYGRQFISTIFDHNEKNTAMRTVDSWDQFNKLESASQDLESHLQDIASKTQSLESALSEFPDWDDIVTTDTVNDYSEDIRDTLKEIQLRDAQRPDKFT